MMKDFARLADTAPDALWDEEAAGRYDTPGVGMFSEEVLSPAVDRLAELADGGRALEFGIGTGRVAIPLVERGVPVAGVEYSRPMIARLREKVGSDVLPVVRGDMSSARVSGAFDLVYLVFNTIANLLTQDAQVRCFRNAAAHLRPGGRFVIELWVPQLRHLSRSVPATVAVADDGYFLVDAMDTATQRLISYHVRFGEASDASVTRTPHRDIWPSELDLMARLAGFELESRWADWDGAEFTADSTSHVSVYVLA
jgi:SAM-dependent methyltransferase